MAKDETPPSTLVDFFASASYDDPDARKGKRFSSKKSLAIIGGVTLVTVAGLTAASMLIPKTPHAEQVGTSLSQWSEANGRDEIPETTEYVPYYSYLTGLGPRIAEFGLPNFGKKSGDVMVKIIQKGAGGSPFTVCSYDTSAPKDPKSLVKEYTYYSFNSETNEVKTDDPTCDPAT